MSGDEFKETSAVTVVMSHQWSIIMWTEFVLLCAFDRKRSSRNQEQRSHLDAVEVVHSQDGAPLVLVADEAEAFGLPRLLVTHQVDVDNLSIPDRIVGGKGQ